MQHVMEHVSAPYYDVTADEIWTQARGIDHVAHAKVPLLVLHPEDDPIIKVEQARMLAEAAKDNDLVRVWILRAGSHGLLEAADPQLDARRLPDLLRALGDLRGAHRRAGQRAGRRVGLLLAGARVARARRGGQSDGQ